MAATSSDEIGDTGAPEPTKPATKGKKTKEAEEAAVVGVCLEKCQYQSAIVKPGQKVTFPGGIPERLQKLFKPAD